MEIEIEASPNCEGTDFQVFSEIGPLRILHQMRIQKNGKEMICHVCGVEPGGKFVQAKVCPVADSGGGCVYFVYGGKWGLRFKPEDFSHEPWDLSNPHQWGEPYKYYGDEADLIYGEG